MELNVSQVFSKAYSSTALQVVSNHYSPHKLVQHLPMAHRADTAQSLTALAWFHCLPQHVTLRFCHITKIGPSNTHRSAIMHSGALDPDLLACAVTVDYNSHSQYATVIGY